MRFLILLSCVLLVACGGAATDPTPSPTLVPTSTSAPLVDAGAYDEIPTGFTEAGYPQLGDPNAVVQLIEYGSYDSPASRQAHDEIFAQLLSRIADGEVSYIWVPLTGTGSIDNGRGAARAALCAGEQGAFWTYQDLLFRWQADFGETAFSAERLSQGIDEIGLDRSVWEACVLGDSPDSVLNAAAEEALNLESYAGTPTILINGNYVLNDLFSINTIIDQILSQGLDETGELAALPTPSEATPTVDPADVPEDVVLEPLVGEQIPPPIEIDLPPDWEFGYETLLLNDVDAIRTVPFALYTGPVAGNATGTIVLLWGFPNLTTGNPIEAEMGVATPVPNLWTDGLRLLRLAVIEQTCNIGTDLQREYAIGDATGTGTQFSAVDCPDLPDTRGWFVGTQQYDLNLVFYAYIEPINPQGVTEEERLAREQIQAILDTVRFQPIDEFPTGE